MRAIIGAMVTVFLCACGGGTGSSPPERPAGGIDGTVFNAPVSGATVKAYSFSNGSRGELIGEAFTNQDGAFSISLRTPNDLVLLESVGGNYREEASARDITIAPDVPMRSLVSYSSGARAGTSITFFTSVATALTEQLIATGRAPAAAVDEAFGAYNSAMGFDIRGITPADITQVSEATTAVTARHEYGFFEGAISQWTADASATNGTPAHATHNSASLLKLAYDDVRSDGKLDGKAGATQLKVGTISLTVDSYRQQLALAMLKIANSSVNKTGLRASHLLATANRWNNSTSSLFGAGDITPLNPAGPTLSTLTPAAGAGVSGTFTATVNAVDPDGVIEVQFFIDSTLAGTASDPAHPSVPINSNSYSNAGHTLRATAKNSIGGTSSIEHQITINNVPPPPVKDTTPPVVTITAPSGTSTLKNSVTATGTVADAGGVAGSTFLLDTTTLGNSGSATAPRVTIDTKKFPDGVHVLTLRGTDTAGNVTNATRTLIFNN